MVYVLGWKREEEEEEEIGEGEWRRRRGRGGGGENKQTFAGYKKKQEKNLLIKDDFLKAFFILWKRWNIKESSVPLREKKRAFLLLLLLFWERGDNGAACCGVGWVEKRGGGGVGGKKWSDRGGREGVDLTNSLLSSHFRHTW